MELLKMIVWLTTTGSLIIKSNGAVSSKLYDNPAYRSNMNSDEHLKLEDINVDFDVSANIRPARSELPTDSAFTDSRINFPVSSVEPRSLLHERLISNQQPNLSSKQDTFCADHIISENESMIIRSPRYPRKYPNNYHCMTTVDSSSSNKITVDCKGKIRKSRRCKKDYLLICGRDNCFKRLCRRFSKTFVEISDTVYLTFKTNRRRNSRGFECTLSVAGPSNNTTSSTETTATTSTMQTTTITVPKTTTTTPPNCRCGKVNRATRIVGGIKAEVHEYPWLVGLLFSYSSSFSCGGAILSRYWVVTAAHCTKGRSPTSVKIVAGEHTLHSDSDTKKTTVHDITQIINHENYDNPANDNDIALIKLATPVEFDEDNSVAPVCLPPTADKDYVGHIGTVAGWGTTTYKGSVSNVLLEVSIPIVTLSYCRRVYGNYITDNMLCAGTAQGGKDSCQGDSGGPFTTPGGDNNSSNILVGVVSFGYKCAEPGIPGVYARVTEYIDWIKYRILDDETCPM